MDAGGTRTRNPMTDFLVIATLISIPHLWPRLVRFTVLWVGGMMDKTEQP